MKPLYRVFKRPLTHKNYVYPPSAFVNGIGGFQIVPSIFKQMVELLFLYYCRAPELRENCLNKAASSAEILVRPFFGG
jgi:hypothetical protein